MKIHLRSYIYHAENKKYVNYLKKVVICRYCYTNPVWCLSLIRCKIWYQMCLLSVICINIVKIVAAFWGMHVSPEKHSFGQCDRKVWQTDRQTDRQTTDKVIPMCRYASQATQKPPHVHASCQVSWNSVSSFKGEVENVTANQRPGWPSCYSNRPEKHRLGGGSWDLASCQVSLNYMKWFQRKNQNCLGQSEPGAAIFSVFPIIPKNSNLVEDLKILLPVKFGWIPFRGFRGEVENVKS